MCFGCEHADRKGLTVLSCEGVPIVHRITAGQCPLNRHPDPAGVVKWAGIRWLGVPYPLRLWAWLMHPKHPRPSSIRQCGCIKPLKELWISVTRKLSLRRVFKNRASLH